MEASSLVADSLIKHTHTHRESFLCECTNFNKEERKASMNGVCINVYIDIYFSKSKHLKLTVCSVVI